MTSDGGGGDAGADGRVYPDARLFDRVEVAPLARLLDEDVGDMHVGGPCWPEGEAAAALRYLDHEGRPLDRPTPRGRGGAAEVETVPGTWWWIGPLTRHFGHFLSEFATRIRPVLDHDPQARLVFARSFGGPFPAPRAAPSFVEAVLDWHGAALDRVRFVDRPTRFERLGSCPQPERLYPGPESAPRTPYLDALSARLRARLGPRRAEGTIYVSRARAQRLYAGEIEVEAAMAAAGVRVVHPETLPLAEQLATIRNAETAIFAEGSALHLLQLGGRDFGRIVVLTRRPGHRMAEHLLAPRCEELIYLDTAERLLAGHKPQGDVRISEGLCVPSPERIEAALAPLGVDLGGRIDRAAFRREAGRDLRRFARTLRRTSFGRGGRSVQAMASGALASGLPGRRRAVASIVLAWGRAALARRLARLSSGRSGRRGS